MMADDTKNNQYWDSLERLDWHLWVLAILLIFVLGVGLLGFMFPSSFWSGAEQSSPTSQRAFFGFFVLLALVLVYLLQRQAAVRRLKRQLFEARAAAAAVEREAAVQAFRTLPGAVQFRDALAMEYRRASASGTSVSRVLLTTPDASGETLGHVVHLLHCILRRGESLYKISDKAVAIIFPGLHSSDVASLVAHVEMLSGIPKEDLELNLTTYPDEVPSLTELEGRISWSAK